LLCVNLYSQNFTDQLNAGDDEPTIWEGWGAAVIVRGVGDYTDRVWISKYCTGKDHTQMRINVGDNQLGDDCAVIGITIEEEPRWKGIYYFYNNDVFFYFFKKRYDIISCITLGGFYCGKII